MVYLLILEQVPSKTTYVPMEKQNGCYRSSINTLPGTILYTIAKSKIHTA